MGTLTAAMFMTVDGFTEKPDGTLISPAWSDDLQVHWSGANAHEGQLLLYGRRAFEINAGHWPTAAADPGNPEDYRAFAATMNALPKVVVSDTLSDVGWNATIETGPLAQVVDRVKRRFDGEIVAVGGVGLVRSLVTEGLADRFRFLLMPEMAGAGRSIFDPSMGGDGSARPAQLELVSNQTMDTGAIIVEYAVAEAP